LRGVQQAGNAQFYGFGLVCLRGEVVVVLDPASRIHILGMRSRPLARLERLAALALELLRQAQLLGGAELPLLFRWFRPREQLHLELERRAGGNLGRRAALAVGIVGAAEELGLLALVHGRDALVPTLDDRALADLELEVAWPVARRVELGAIRE